MCLWQPWCVHRSWPAASLACSSQSGFALERNRFLRNWPIYGYLGHELVRKPGYSTMLRIQGAALIVIAILIFFALASMRT
jgi:hypothetical protein